VRLHLFGHSLGVTVAHDFLYGLFTEKSEPNFLTEGPKDLADRLRTWREKRRKHELSLGAFVSAASQLPLLVMRKQKLVDLLYDAKVASSAGKPAIGIDPADIGVAATDRVQWKIFYDTDDLLGFATRGLYTLADGKAHPAIADVQVNSGCEPLGAHTGYWTDETVIRETAELVAAWAG
jgi:hypothetical protein